MKEIVKVQRPLSSNKDAPPWLIYSEGKLKMETRETDLIDPAVKSAMGDDPKGYFEAEWAAQGGWKIGARVKDQDW
jgi:hypothetical protein